MGDRRELWGGTALEVVVDVDTAVLGLEVGKAALVGAVEGSGSLIDDGALADGSCGLGGGREVGPCVRRVLGGGALDSAVGLYTASAVYETLWAWADGASLAAGETRLSILLLSGFGKCSGRRVSRKDKRRWRGVAYRPRGRRGEQE